MAIQKDTGWSKPIFILETKKLLLYLRREEHLSLLAYQTRSQMFQLTTQGGNNKQAQYVSTHQIL